MSQVMSCYDRFNVGLMSLSLSCFKTRNCYLWIIRKSAIRTGL